MSNTIIIVSYTDYPKGTAGALRTHEFAKLLQVIGYKTLVIGMGRTENRGVLQNFEGIEYISLRENGDTLLKRIIGLLSFHRKCFGTIKQYDNLKGIFIVSASNKTFRSLKVYGKKKHIPIYHDSVEWYSPGQFRLRKFSYPYIEKEIQNRIIVDRDVNVIAISSYLESYYSSKGICTIKIPVIFDTSKMNVAIKDNKKLELIYAGSPGKKDFLLPIVEGLGFLNEDQRNRLNLSIFGITKSEFLKVNRLPKDKLNFMMGSLQFFGKVPHDEVIKHLKGSDFTVLLRDSSLRYAKAGFPTKVVESLSYGIPCIANYSSDLDQYLFDMDNSLIVPDCSAKSFSDTVSRALSLTIEEIRRLKERARQTAETHFDSSVYKQILSDFFGESD